MKGPLRLLSRPVVSSVIGVCLGIALSIIFTPFLEERCLESLNEKSRVVVNDKPDAQKSMSSKEAQEHNVHRGMKLNHEQPGMGPPIKEPNASIKKNDDNVKDLPHQGNDRVLKPNVNMNSKHSRPLFANSELGIREKLFVAVLSSVGTINTFGTALNQTLSPYVSKLLFFLDSVSGIQPPFVDVVACSCSPSQLPIHVIKYIRQTISNSYDYYYFVTDSSYIRGRFLYNFVSHISIAQDIFVGKIHTQAEEHVCSLSGGILLSQSVLSKTYDYLDMCLEISDSLTSSKLFTECIHRATKLTCEASLQSDSYPVFYIEKPDNPFDLAPLMHNSSFLTSLVVSKIKDYSLIYKLHRFFCQLEINETKHEIEQISEEIKKLSIYTPAGEEGLTWPIGVPSPLKPQTRFEVLQWDYFTTTHIYIDSDFSNEQLLSGADKRDIEEILKICTDKIDIEYLARYTVHGLLNGYRRFNFRRGMEYIIDITLSDKQSSSIEYARIHVLRSLGNIELVPIPHVIENVPINLVLPIHSHKVNELHMFLEYYEHTCLNTRDNIYLTIVFIYDRNSVHNHRDVFYAAKDLLSYYMTKYSQTTKISALSVQVSGEYVPQLSLLDTVVKLLEGPPLISLCTVGMILTREYIHRIRVSSLEGAQVYFPIPFYQYKHSFIFGNNVPQPAPIEIRRGHGFFDTHSFNHASFYVSDYMLGRKAIPPDIWHELDLFDVFVTYQKLYIFRVIEPALKHFYSDPNCPSDMPNVLKSRCQLRRSTCLAPKSRLASIVLETNSSLI